MDTYMPFPKVSYNMNCTYSRNCSEIHVGMAMHPFQLDQVILVDHGIRVVLRVPHRPRRCMENESTWIFTCTYSISFISRLTLKQRILGRSRIQNVSHSYPWFASTSLKQIINKDQSMQLDLQRSTERSNFV